MAASRWIHARSSPRPRVRSCGRSTIGCPSSWTGSNGPSGWIAERTHSGCTHFSSRMPGSSRRTRSRVWSTRRRTTCRLVSCPCDGQPGLARRAVILRATARANRYRGTGMLTEFDNARFLVVDDEEHNVRLLERLLVRAGYTQYKCTTDPRYALPIFLEFAPDIVLLDLHMPHMDGFTVLEDLRHRMPGGAHVPVLVLTGDVSADVRRR